LTTAQIVVTLLGLAGIAWVNHYFFLARRSGSVGTVMPGAGRQRIRVVVDGGYSPAVVRVAAGRPVLLEFDRRETSGCTEEVVLPDFGIRMFLTPHRITPVEFTPSHPGSYEFTCGMGMIRGKILAESPVTGRGST
jgi:plastocyanin domain-containing protein